MCEQLSQRLVTDAATGHLLLSPSPLCEKQIGEAECGHCTYIMSGKEIYIGEEPKNQFGADSKGNGGKPWSLLRSQSLFLPAVESAAPLFAFIINTCVKDKCSPELEKVKVKLDSLNGVSTIIKSLSSP